MLKLTSTVLLLAAAGVALPAEAQDMQSHRAAYDVSML